MMRPLGISAFVRCKNEEEYIVASLMSAYRIFDEIVVILNNSSDRTRELIQFLMKNRPKIRLLEYPNQCAPAGVGYFDKVVADPEASLAKYYNWCLEQTSFSHVCKWDGDMIGLPTLEDVRRDLDSYDAVAFDGYDILGENTTDCESRIFRYDSIRARYVDWDLYEILQHDYSRMRIIEPKCYVHMKLVKNDWLDKQWQNPNDRAERSVPPTGAASSSKYRRLLRSVVTPGMRSALKRLRFRSRKQTTTT